MWGRMRPCDFFKGGSNGIRGEACGVGSASDGLEGKRIDAEGVTVNWLALYRYGMDFGNMGFLPYLEFTPMLSPDPALRHRHSKEEWRRLIDEFQDSGLSRQKFCASRGISLPHRAAAHLPPYWRTPQWRAILRQATKDRA